MSLGRSLLLRLDFPLLKAFYRTECMYIYVCLYMHFFYFSAANLHDWMFHFSRCLRFTYSVSFIWDENCTQNQNDLVSSSFALTLFSSISCYFFFGCLFCCQRWCQSSLCKIRPLKPWLLYKEQDWSHNFSFACFAVHSSDHIMKCKRCLS